MTDRSYSEGRAGKQYAQLAHTTAVGPKRKTEAKTSDLICIVPLNLLAPLHTYSIHFTHNEGLLLSVD